MEDSLTCLKIIFNLGNVRKDGGGKQDRRNFYQSLLWLWRKHPENVLANIRLLHQHASLKCLLNVFMYIVHLEKDSVEKLEGEAAAAASVYSLSGQAAAAGRHKAAKASIRSKKTKKDRRESRKARRVILWAEFARSMEKAVDQLRVKRNRDEITAKRGAEFLNEHVLADPRVATKWRTGEIAAQFAAFCKAKDAENAKKQKEIKQALNRQTRALTKQRRTDGYILRLYEAVVDIFCEGIQKEYKDMLKLEAQLTEAASAAPGSDPPPQISVGGLYAKWAPRVGGLHDKATGIARKIMAKLLPMLGLDPVINPTAKPGILQQKRQQRYQRDVLSRIHRAAQVPEHFVGRAQWDQVNYNRMASRCRLLYGTKVFRKHDEKRYDAYLQRSAVSQLTDKAAKGGVKTGALLPHEITSKADLLEKSEEDKASPAYLAKTLEFNLQWWGLVRACREARAEDAGGEGGGLGNCLPMCDVSGSMQGTPMEVSVALSILLAESMPRDSPLFGKIMTFHEQPKLCSLQDIPDYDGEEAEKTRTALAAAAAAADPAAAVSSEQTRQLLSHLGNIGARAGEVLGYEWGGSTNIEAAFNLMLALAREHHLDAAYVSRTCLVIFSDMEFDEARGIGYSPRENVQQSWDTMHEHIQKRFAAAGYPVLPRIVYWNLRASLSQPIKEQDRKNVVLLAGFSAGLLRSFLKGQLDDFNPIRQLQQVLSGPLYEQLVVPRIN